MLQLQIFPFFTFIEGGGEGEGNMAELGWCVLRILGACQVHLERVYRELYTHLNYQASTDEIYPHVRIAVLVIVIGAYRQLLKFGGLANL